MPMGGARDWENIVGGRTVQAKAFTHFFKNGTNTCAMPRRICSYTWLDAMPIIGIPAEETKTFFILHSSLFISHFSFLFLRVLRALRVLRVRN